MSWKNDQYAPPDEILQLLLRGLVCPNLLWIQEQVGKVPFARFAVWVNGTPGRSWIVGPHGICVPPDQSSIIGEVRAYFRRTFKENRSLFHYEMILDDISPSTGFTGFVVRGEMKRLKDGTTVFREHSQVRQYNVRSFSGPS